MKVRLLTSIVLGNNLGSYCIGEEVTFGDDFAEKLISSGYAVEVKEKKSVIKEDKKEIKEENKEEDKEKKPKATRKPRTSKAKSE